MTRVKSIVEFLTQKIDIQMIFAGNLKPTLFLNESQVTISINLDTGIFQYLPTSTRFISLTTLMKYLLWGTVIVTLLRP